jgi:hypothetical protein
MHPVLQLVLAVCAVALTWALVVALLQLRRTAARAESVLDVVERELRPAAAQLQALAEELRGLLEQARGEVARVSALANQAERLAGRIGRVLGAIGGLTRVGQAVGFLAALRRGVDAVVSRLAKHG